MFKFIAYLKSFLNAYKVFWIKAINFNSKTSRSDWWRVQFINLIIFFLTISIFLRTFGFNIYGIVCIIPQVAIDVRRLRDFGKDWKWIFINLIPVFGWIVWFIWLGFGESGNGKSKFIQIFQVNLKNLNPFCNEPNFPYYSYCSLLNFYSDSF